MTTPPLPDVSTAARPSSVPESSHVLRPYHFSPYGGAGFLRPGLGDRRDLLATLRARGARLEAEAAGLDGLSREVGATRPAHLAALAERCDRLQEEWEERMRLGPARTEPLIESLLLPYVEARIPLRPRRGGSAWVHGTLLRLLELYEAFGSVHAAYDGEWRRAQASPNEPGVVVRLALAAAWLSWSELIVDRTTALAHLNVLGDLVDRVDTGLHREGWDLDPRGLRWALAAVTLERRLVVHWSPHDRLAGDLSR